MNVAPVSGLNIGRGIGDKTRIGADLVVEFARRSVEAELLPDRGHAGLDVGDTFQPALMNFHGSQWQRCIGADQFAVDGLSPRILADADRFGRLCRIGFANCRGQLRKAGIDALGDNSVDGREQLCPLNGRKFRDSAVRGPQRVCRGADGLPGAAYDGEGGARQVDAALGLLRHFGGQRVQHRRIAFCQSDIMADILRRI